MQAIGELKSGYRRQFVTNDFIELHTASKTLLYQLHDQPFLFYALVNTHYCLEAASAMRISKLGPVFNVQRAAGGEAVAILIVHHQCTRIMYERLCCYATVERVHPDHFLLLKLSTLLCPFLLYALYTQIRILRCCLRSAASGGGGAWLVFFCRSPLVPPRRLLGRILPTTMARTAPRPAGRPGSLVGCGGPTDFSRDRRPAAPRRCSAAPRLCYQHESPTTNSGGGEDAGLWAFYPVCSCGDAQIFHFDFYKICHVRVWAICELRIRFHRGGYSSFCLNLSC